MERQRCRHPSHVLRGGRGSSGGHRTDLRTGGHRTGASALTEGSESAPNQDRQILPSPLASFSSLRPEGQTQQNHER